MCVVRDRYFWVLRTVCLLAVVAAPLVGCSVGRGPIVEPSADAGSQESTEPGRDGGGSVGHDDDGGSEDAMVGPGGPDAGQADGGGAGIDGGPAPVEDAAADSSGSEMDARPGALEAGATDSAGSETGPGDTGSDGGADAATGGADAEQPLKPKFGLACGQVTCPAVPGDVDQCCTTADDVSAYRARELERCGVDLTARGGPACVQLEQHGLLDPDCPSATPAGALLEEPGCCSDEGLCGFFNAAEGIGCHYDGEPGEACSDVEPGIGCEPTGTFAVRAEVDTSWGGRTGGSFGILYELTEDGRGDIVVLLLATVDEVNDDGEFVAGVKVCRAELPPFYSETLCEAYQPVLPDAMWESEQNRVLPVSGHYQCHNPGCFVTLEPYTALIGIALDDPDGEWPAPEEALEIECSLGQGEDCYPDFDEDGHPGTTVDVLTEGLAPPVDGCGGAYAHSAPPLSASIAAVFGLVRRADRLHLGVRMRLGGSSSLNEECGFERGSGVADFVQSRAAGCMVQRGTRGPGEPAAGQNEPCTAQEIGFMNSNLPTYDVLAAGEMPPQESLQDGPPSEGPAFRIVRLGGVDTPVTCEDVRQVVFP